MTEDRAKLFHTLFLLVLTFNYTAVALSLDIFLESSIPLHCQYLRWTDFVLRHCESCAHPILLSYVPLDLPAYDLPAPSVYLRLHLKSVGFV